MGAGRRKKFLCFLQRPAQHRGPPNPAVQWILQSSSPGGKIGWGVELITYPHLVPSLRIKGRRLPLVSSNFTAFTGRSLIWRTYIRLCLYRMSGLTLMIRNKMEENKDVSN